MFQAGMALLCGPSKELQAKLKPAIFRPDSNTNNGDLPMQLKAIPLALFLITSFAIATPAFAETSPEDASDYRHSVMESLGSHAHAFFLIFAGKVDQRDQMATHANAIAAVGAEIGTLFPEGSDVDDSHALPLIWDEPEQFS